VAPITLEVPVQEARFWTTVVHYGGWPLGIVAAIAFVWFAVRKRARLGLTHRNA
jgi:hypothetical protein